MEHETESKINCAEACVSGCALGDKCPNLEYKDRAVAFISETSLDRMHEIAEMARRKKMMEPPKWVIPDYP